MDFIEIEEREKNKKCAVSELHTHNYYEIYCLISGKRDFFLEGSVFELSERNICIVPPFRMHKSEGGAYKRINLYVSPDLLDAAEERFLEANAGALRFEENSKKEELFFMLASDAADTKSAVRERKYTTVIVKTLISLLIFGETQTITPKGRSDKEKNEDSFVLDIVRYLNDHYTERITLEDITEKFFVSKNILCKKFYSEMNCSVMEYCQRLRINRAKTLLLSSEMSIEEISGMCGYSSANYFSLIFTKKVGLSPLNYRKKK